ncbi:N-acetyltransferase [Salegentibacter sp. Hel_I_6]|uniref:GNAT family N-acetyltransferase n=1 Tax=Salegentibacter sp. Hel_I_6 TaxID=1250278 RepID=UPI0012E041C7|nr:GNAT family N-acetyltransferase [Salegentibacter sp. Hel_I_6]
MLKLNFNPTEKHLADIENWLIEEWNNSGSGFYSNWSMIPKAFRDKRLNIITENDYAIGFVVFRASDLDVEIDIAEIKPSERKRGIAKKLIDGTLDILKQNGILVAKLYCQPENSEKFWKKVGFKNFPKFIDDSQIYMFKPLVETLKSTEKTDGNSTIKLWNCGTHQADKKNEKWIWNLNFKADNETLIRPIIFPVSRDWHTELTLNGEKLKSIKVKYLRIDLCDYPGFMIIRKVSQ